MNRVVPIIILVLVAVVALFYFNGGTSNSLTVKSAQLVGRSQLMIDVQNDGQSSTTSVQVLETCSPDYSECQSLSVNPVNFNLSAGAEHSEKLSIPKCGFAPFLPCTILSPGAPVPGQTYYFKIRVTFRVGSPIVLNLAAKAVGASPFANLFTSLTPPPDLTLTSLDSASLPLFGNLTGRMSVVFSLNKTITSLITVSLLNKTSFEPGVGVRHALASVSVGTTCGIYCSPVVKSKPSTVNLTTTFSTATTGVKSGEYYMIGISFQYYGAYYFWMTAGSAITRSTATTTEPATTSYS